MRLGLLADIHANLEALRAVLADGEEAYVDEWWVLGDVLGRGPYPVETLELLWEHVDPRRWLLGNHDIYIKQLLMPPDGTVDEADRFTWGDHQRQLKEHFSSKHSDRLFEWYCAWDWGQVRPQRLIAEQAECWLVHAALDDESDKEQARRMNIGDVPRLSYIMPWNTVEHRAIRRQQYHYLCSFAGDEECTKVLIHGHTHVPYIEAKVWNTDLWTLLPIRYGIPQPLASFEAVLINPGSVGQPRNGDPMVHAAYGILDTQGTTFEFRRVPYNSEPTRLAMGRLNYDISLIRLLEPSPADHPGRYNKSYRVEWYKTYRETPEGWEPLVFVS